MTARQLVVLSVVLLAGGLLYVAPRRANDAAGTIAAAPAGPNAAFEQQLDAVKQQTDPSVLTLIEFYEGRIGQASGMEKAAWFDSLARAWDHQMRPGIAAEYVFMKAGYTNATADWLMAGKRFLGISRFFGPEDKQLIAQRAVECLEKAYRQDSSDAGIKTQLGSAYTEAGREPMKGIFLLREVVAKDPENVEAQLNLGFFAMQSGQYDKAVERFSTVIKLTPDDVPVRFYLSEALAGSGKKNEAMAELRKIGSQTNDTMLLREAERRIGQLKKH